jgi:hypothetical protein
MFIPGSSLGKIILRNRSDKKSEHYNFLKIFALTSSHVFTADGFFLYSSHRSPAN